MEKLKSDNNDLIINQNADPRASLTKKEKFYQLIAGSYVKEEIEEKLGLKIAGN
jgi:hypothetical protein